MRELIVSATGGVQAVLGLDDAQFLLVARVLALAAGVLTVAITAWSVRRLRRPSPARWRPAVFGLAATVLATLAYLVLLQPPVNTRIAVPLVVFGVLLGMLQGSATRLYWEGRELIARRTAFYVALWGIAFAGTQALAQLQNAALHAVGILTVMLTVGVAAGVNANLLTRQALMRARGPR